MNKSIVTLAATLLVGCAGGNSPVPEGTAANPALAADAIPIVNGDFEQSASDGSIPGWRIVQHAGVPAYEMVVEPVAAYSGHGGFRMTRTQEQVYGTLAQDINLPLAAGGEFELSAMMKSKDVGPKGWRLMLIADLPQYSPSLVGTTDWQRMSVRVKLKPGAHTVRVGVTLIDRGTGYADDIELKRVAP